MHLEKEDTMTAEAPKKDIPERDLADETPLIEAEKKATKEEEQTVSEKKLSEKQEEKVSLEVQQQMDDTEKEQATKKKAASIPAHSLLPYIQETVNGIRSIKDFNVEAKKIDWIKLFHDSGFSHIEKAFKNSKAEDFAFDLFAGVLVGTLQIMHDYMKQSYNNMKEAQQKTQENRDKSIKEKLSAHKTSLPQLASRVAYWTQHFLMDEHMLPHNEDGSIRKTKLTPHEKANYKKYKFAHNLPTTSDGSFDFNKFSWNQKRIFAGWVVKYATQNPQFKQYVESMMEAAVTDAELKELGRNARTLIKRNRAPVYTPNQQHALAA